MCKFEIGDLVIVKDTCTYGPVVGEVARIVDVRSMNSERFTVCFEHLKDYMKVDDYGVCLHDGNLDDYGNKCLFLYGSDLEKYEEDFWRI